MDNGVYEIRKGEIVHKTRPPLDVRIVAYLLYSLAFWRVGLAILLASGVAKPAESHRVLFSSLPASSPLSHGVYWFLIGLCYFICAWGLMRRVTLAWWFTVLFSLYESTDTVFMLSKYHHYAVDRLVGTMVFLAWLWFRRGLYAVHLTPSHTEV
jgi:lysylphosphatidylglycerol synthetase-like protein (DUF2156 family)